MADDNKGEESLFDSSMLGALTDPVRPSPADSFHPSTQPPHSDAKDHHNDHQSLSEQIANSLPAHEDRRLLEHSDVMPPPPQQVHSSVLGKRHGEDIMPAVLPPMQRPKARETSEVAMGGNDNTDVTVLMHSSDMSLPDLRDIPSLPRVVSEREMGSLYLDSKGRVRFWNGKRLLCEHKKRQEVCNICGGSSLCEHNRERSKCKACGGSAICEHKKVRSRCKDCGGASICIHNAIRSQCKDCGGGSLCSHGRKRSLCRECGGSAFCQHDRVKSKCKICRGSSVCEHNRQKYHCKKCGGSAICKHDKIKYQCKICASINAAKKEAEAALSAVGNSAPIEDSVLPPSHEIPPGFAQNFPSLDP